MVPIQNFHLIFELGVDGGFESGPILHPFGEVDDGVGFGVTSLGILGLEGRDVVARATSLIPSMGGTYVSLF